VSISFFLIVRCKLDSKGKALKYKNDNAKKGGCQRGEVDEIMEPHHGCLENYNELSKELYAEVAVQFREACRKFPKFLNYVENIIIESFGGKKKLFI